MSFWTGIIITLDTSPSKEYIDIDQVDDVVDKETKNKYTLILKDAALPETSHRREKSSVSWELDFTQVITKSKWTPQYREERKDEVEILLPFARFRAMYRGRPIGKSKNNKLDTSSITQLSLMTRSFSGQQQGEFRLRVVRIGVFSDKPEEKADCQGDNCSFRTESDDSVVNEKAQVQAQARDYMTEKQSKGNGKPGKKSGRKGKWLRTWF